MKKYKYLIIWYLIEFDILWKGSRDSLQIQNLLWSVNHILDSLQLLFQSVHHLSEQGGFVRFLFCFTHSRYFINDLLFCRFGLLPVRFVSAKLMRKESANKHANICLTVYSMAINCGLYTPVHPPNVTDFMLSRQMIICENVG